MSITNVANIAHVQLWLALTRLYIPFNFVSFSKGGDYSMIRDPFNGENGRLLMHFRVTCRNTSDGFDTVNDDSYSIVSQSLVRDMYQLAKLVVDCKIPQVDHLNYVRKLLSLNLGAYYDSKTGHDMWCLDFTVDPTPAGIVPLAPSDAYYLRQYQEEQRKKYKTISAMQPPVPTVASAAAPAEGMLNDATKYMEYNGLLQAGYWIDKYLDYLDNVGTYQQQYHQYHYTPSYVANAVQYAIARRAPENYKAHVFENKWMEEEGAVELDPAGTARIQANRDLYDQVVREEKKKIEDLMGYAQHLLKAVVAYQPNLYIDVTPIEKRIRDCPDMKKEEVEALCKDACVKAHCEYVESQRYKQSYYYYYVKPDPWERIQNDPRYWSEKPTYAGANIKRAYKQEQYQYQYQYQYKSELAGLVPLSDEEKKKVARVFPQSLRDVVKRENADEADALMKEHQLRETLIKLHGLAVDKYGVENVLVDVLKRLEPVCKLMAISDPSLCSLYELELEACMQEKKYYYQQQQQQLTVSQSKLVGPQTPKGLTIIGNPALVIDPITGEHNFSCVGGVIIDNTSSTANGRESNRQYLSRMFGGQPTQRDIIMKKYEEDLLDPRKRSILIKVVLPRLQHLGYNVTEQEYDRIVQEAMQAQEAADMEATEQKIAELVVEDAVVATEVVVQQDDKQQQHQEEKKDYF